MNIFKWLRRSLFDTVDLDMNIITPATKMVIVTLSEGQDDLPIEIVYEAYSKFIKEMMDSDLGHVKVVFMHGVKSVSVE